MSHEDEEFQGDSLVDELAKALSAPEDEPADEPEPEDDDDFESEPEDDEDDGSEDDYPPDVEGEQGKEKGGKEPPSFREKLKSVGFNADKYQSDDEAIRGLVEAAKRLSQRDESAYYWQQFQQNPAFRQQVLQQVAPQQPPQPQQPKSNPLAEWNPEWEEYLGRDEEGNLVAKPGAPPEVVPKYQAYQKALTKRLQDIARGELVTPQQVEQRAAEIAQQIVQQQFGQFQQQSQEFATANSWIETNKSWLFVDGDKTKGGTPAGHEFTNTIQKFSHLPFEQQVEIGMLAVQAKFPKKAEKPAKKPTRSPSRSPSRPKKPTLEERSPSDFTLTDMLNDVIEREGFDKVFAGHTL